jgi:hypothetical protein
MKQKLVKTECHFHTPYCLATNASNFRMKLTYNNMITMTYRKMVRVPIDLMQLLQAVIDAFINGLRIYKRQTET